ncbi:DUF5605 domain-containing protein [Micromonospora sp. CPCC 205371]|nr:DUF5605 domain-containing protein [Micromonospora sp. CPCC 205371]
MCSGERERSGAWRLSSGEGRDLPIGGVGQSWQLAYFGFTRPRLRTFTMPAGIRYRVDVIDTWQMTVTEARGRFKGTFTVELPARPFVAVRLRAVP